MILPDSEIKKYLNNGELKVISQDKYDVFEQIGPASLDFRLGNTFKMYKKSSLSIIDPRIGIDSKDVETIILDDDTPFILHPGQFVLGVTLETISMPYDLVARCEGRSSIARLGVIIHSTAGFIDPGFRGTTTLEITNINEVPVALYPGMRIGQYAFHTLSGVVDVPYDQRKGSKYMNQSLPEESRIVKDLY